MITLGDLERLLPDESVYPKDVISPISPRLLGRSFFPGGRGLVGHEQQYPERPIMLVGQDFGTRSYWENDLTAHHVEHGEDDSKGTWWGIRQIAAACLLRRERCFFTNALLGVRDNFANPEIKIYGPSPGLSFPSYVKASLHCLESQIELLRPSVVVALGTVPATLLAQRWHFEPPPWPNAKRESSTWREAKWREIDGAGLQFRASCVLPNEHECAFATCTHPSMPNAKHRKWTTLGLDGEEAEHAIWRKIRTHDDNVIGRRDTIH